MAENLLISIAFLLLGAKTLGYLTERLGFSSLIGEVVAGILLGPAVLGLVQASDGLAQLANFGILFFLFLMGLSTKFDDFKDKVYPGSGIAIAGAVLSFALGFGLGYLAFNSLMVAVFLGAAFTSSSTVITLRLFEDRSHGHAIAGRYITPVAIADDVIAIMAIALFGTYISLGTLQISQAVTLFLAVLGFFLLLLTFGSRVLGYALAFGKRAEHDEHMIVSIALALLFTIAFISEQVGVAAVTGAFLAGMAMNRSDLAEKEILPKAKIIGYSLFIPLFFAHSALSIDLAGLSSSLLLVAGLALAVMAAKVAGCFFACRAFGLPKGDGLLLGLAMAPRGEYSIIIAQLALATGAITAPSYSIAIAAVALTIFIGPVLFKAFASRW
ncbi:MAG: cation:proton antiporter [Candidatus Aenigmarchaeota archaeon]|nr:cation:proton antiporter [Candidatus Aenigmarchaeota archaeon]